MLIVLFILLYVLLGIYACYFTVKEITKEKDFTYSDLVLFLAAIIFPPGIWIAFFISKQEDKILWKQKD